MLLRRYAWVLIASAAFVAGCQGPQRSKESHIDRSGRPDTFGNLRQGEGERITVEQLELDEMINQRAQLEFKLGAAKMFDIFDPSQSSDVDPGPYFGGKFSFEAFKNVFLGLAVDVGFHDVDDPPPSAGGVPTAGSNQIDQIDNYTKANFLVTADYDVPLWRDAKALIFRMGVATGVTWIKLEERPDTLNTFESFWSWIFRPSIGLRKPINKNFLVFLEASYDLVPQRSLETNETATVVGTRPVFSAAGLWLGVAFQW